MLNAALALGLLIILSILLFISILAGHAFGKRQMDRQKYHKLEVITVAETTVFALLGLLIAFTFAGAYQRFEARELHVIDEANAIETAYQRLDLLAPGTEGNLVSELRDYINANLIVYNDIPHFMKALYDLETVAKLKEKLWQDVVVASKLKGNNAIVQMQLVTAFNALFDQMSTGLALILVHPPAIIYLLLILLAILGGFLVGYSTAEKQQKISLHVLCYVFLTAFTIYLNIELELPRIGLIRVNSFDQVLTRSVNSILSLHDGKLVYSSSR